MEDKKAEQPDEAFSATLRSTLKEYPYQVRLSSPDPQITEEGSTPSARSALSAIISPYAKSASVPCLQQNIVKASNP